VSQDVPAGRSVGFSLSHVRLIFLLCSDRALAKEMGGLGRDSQSKRRRVLAFALIASLPLCT
jgi:hypothetical protein